jgi:hypothetical protein
MSIDHRLLPCPPGLDEEKWRTIGATTLMCAECPDNNELNAPCRFWAKGQDCPGEAAVHA